MATKAAPTTVSLRLDRELSHRLASASKAAGVSKSEYIRQCLNAHFEGETKPQPTAWEIGKDLFGCCASERGDLSVRVEELVREKIHAKHAEESRRRQRAAHRAVRRQ